MISENSGSERSNVKQVSQQAKHHHGTTIFLRGGGKSKSHSNMSFRSRTLPDAQKIFKTREEILIFLRILYHLEQMAFVSSEADSISDQTVAQAIGVSLLLVGMGMLTRKSLMSCEDSQSQICMLLL